LESWAITDATYTGLSIITTVPKNSINTNITGLATSETLQTVSARGNVADNDLITKNSGYHFRARYTDNSNIYHASLNWYG
jgi:hypothetical protein